MGDQPETTAKGRLAVALGWLLLLPIFALWLKYRQGYSGDGHYESPGESVFLFAPICFLIGVSFLMYLLVRQEHPGRPMAGLFFWIACCPILVEVVVALLA